MPEYDRKHIWERLQILEARVRELERERDSSPERLHVAGAFGKLAFVKTNASLASGGSAACSLYYEGSTGALADSGSDPTVYAPPYLTSGYSVASGKWGLALRLFKRLWWIGGECPEESA